MSNLSGFIFEHSVDDLSVWTVNLQERDRKMIERILSQYEGSGVSVRGGITYEGIETCGCGWIPTSMGFYPEEGTTVQVTYLGYHDGKPHCDGLAFYSGEKWFWANDGEDDIVIVPITAWKHIGEPYLSKTKKKVKVERRKK